MSEPYILTGLCEGRLSTLKSALDATRALNGEVWECGVCRGGSALVMATHMRETLDGRLLRLFDTFTGIPSVGEWDTHVVGAFGDTSEARVRALFATFDPSFHVGVIPTTFAGLEGSTITVAHIDVDTYDSVLACLTFIYPRMPRGGWIVLDDYGCPGCPGAKRAVDGFMVGKVEGLVVGPTSQAHLVKA